MEYRDALPLVPGSPRVLAVGVDAGEPIWLERWLEEGALPTLSRIIKWGTYGRLQSVGERFYDAVWPSLYTGTGPATHGNYGFRRVKPGTVRLVLGMNRSYKRPFWWLLRHLDKNVVVFDVPKVLIQDGADRQVIGWGAHGPVFLHASRPPRLLREIRRRFGRHPHYHEVFPTRSVGHEQKILRRILIGAERRAEATRFLMNQAPWDLFITVFSESHSAGHQFYHHLDPTSPAHDSLRAQVLEGAMREAYIGVDGAIGHILEACPLDADVLVFSVHGVETQYTTHNLLEPLLVRLGYQVPASADKVDPLPALRDSLPGWFRDQINSLLPLSVQNALISRYFENSVDWRKTRAVVEGSAEKEGSPWIRINLRGREPWGIVEPGREYDALCAELSDELMKLRIHPGGQRAVREVWRTDQFCQGPHLRELPDLGLHWERGTVISMLTHPSVGTITSDLLTIPKSQHSSRAFLAAAGPHFKRGGQLTDARITDLAPTILYLMGSRIPSNMEGRVLSELIQEEFLAEHPIEMEETHWDVEAW
jgi:predicted AlkP superfamily phosphohydrolase/phosphomutase